MITGAHQIKIANQSTARSRLFWPRCDQLPGESEHQEDEANNCIIGLFQPVFDRRYFQILFPIGAGIVRASQFGCFLLRNNESVHQESRTNDVKNQTNYASPFKNFHSFPPLFGRNPTMTTEKRISIAADVLIILIGIMATVYLFINSMMESIL